MNANYNMRRYIKTVRVVVVMVYFLWFYVDGKGMIINAKPTSMLATLGMDGRLASCGIIREFQGQVFGKKLRRQLLLTLQSKANKNNNHFNLLSSPRPKLVMDCDLEDSMPP